MTRRSTTIVVALLAATLAGLPSVACAQTPRAERPTYAVGDRWLRNDATWEVTRVEADTYVFSAGPGQEVHLSRNLGVSKVILDGAVTVELSPALDVAWPLEVGKWATAYPTVLSRSALRYGNARAQGRHTWKVEGYEDVSVPAGTFKAFRITHAVSVGVQWSASVWAFTLWYSPEARRFVKGAGNLLGMTFEAVGVGPPAVATPAPPPPSPTPSRAPTREPVVRAPSQAPAAPQPVLAAPASAPPASAPPAAAPPAAAPPVAALPVSDAEGPRIAINYPPPDTKVEREQIVVLGLVTDNVGVHRVQVTVNGLEIPLSPETGEAKGRPIRVPVTLQPGENVVEVTATDRAGNASQVVRTVTRAVPVPAGPPPPRVANRWAVVIGVGQYDHESIPKLRYATRDAEAVYQFLTTKGGYPKDNVLLLTDSTAQKPTLQNIRRALGDFLYRKPAREDMVLIYYAGHGAPEVDAAGTESDGIAKYLIPSDADPESLYSSALPMDEIQRIFGRIQAERVVFFLDTCYSGTAGGRTFARQTLRSNHLDDHFLERLTRSKGRVIITAAGPNEVALETAELRHGVFTYYLLEA
jgi:hypothetical protein